jgi:large subunit ribosomal protein L16
MALMPKRVKYRKHQRGSMKGNATRGNFVAFGEYGLQSLDLHWITGRQIEAGRIAATHFLHREGKVYIRIFPQHSYTAKPLEQRMGKGKAEIEGWVVLKRRWRGLRLQEFLIRCRCVAGLWRGGICLDKLEMK